jgi:large subunit ribosomal protein L3
MKGILGRKAGMTQVFTVEGVLIPVTVVEVLPNVVLQKKTVETDGYEAVQLGLEDVKTQRATKAQIGHASKVQSGPKKYVREIRGNELFDFEVGQEVKADVFAAGDYVDVTGTSKGRGFMGAIVRNNQKMGPASHGSGHHRGLGSLATIGRNNGIINKGHIMAGQEGGYTTTNKNLEVVKVDIENNYVLIKGNVPGPRKGLVVIKSATKKITPTTAKNLVDLTAAKEE